MKRAKPELTVRWSKRDNALMYTGEKSTGGLLSTHFDVFENLEKRTLAQELDERGYDLTTLRFSIRKKVGSR